MTVDISNSVVPNRSESINIFVSISKINSGLHLLPIGKFIRTIY